MLDSPLPSNSIELEIKPCPSCSARLTVRRADVGSQVECPYCKMRFIAEDPNPAQVEPQQTGVILPPRRRGRFEDDDIDHNRPRDYREESSTDGIAVASLILGIISLTGFGCLTGIPAIICGYMGRDSNNRQMAIAGLICGVISIVFTIGVIAMYVMFFMLVGR